MNILSARRNKPTPSQTHGRSGRRLWYNATMSLNIKNEEAHRLARQLAKITGESMATAVTEAIRERLERVRENPRDGMAERLMKIAKECGPLWKEPFRSMDHGDLLYDEKGLPK
jgi:antitoxin VapB